MLVINTLQYDARYTQHQTLSNNVFIRKDWNVSSSKFIFLLPVSLSEFYCILLYFAENVLFLNALSTLHPVCFPVTIPINPLRTNRVKVLHPAHSDFRKFQSFTDCTYGKSKRRKLTELYLKTQQPQFSKHSRSR